MSGAAAEEAFPGRGAVGLWAGALLAAGAAHAALFLWTTQRAAAPPADPGAQVAVTIELAPLAATAAPGETEVAPDEVDAAEAIPPATQTPPPPEPVEPPPDLAAAAPPDAPPAAPAPPTPQAASAQLVPPLPVAAPPDVLGLVAPPRARPRPAPAPIVAARAAPDVETPPSEARRRARAEAPAGARTAAPEAGQGGDPKAAARWRSRLIAHLERRKRYPREAMARGAQGVAQVRFTIDAAGAVTSARLVGASGDAALDAEALALVRRASPVPAPPPGAPRDIVAPFRFATK